MNKQHFYLYEVMGDKVVTRTASEILRKHLILHGKILENEFDRLEHKTVDTMPQDDIS